MSVARKDDRHKEEMVDQIASMFEPRRHSGDENPDETGPGETGPEETGPDATGQASQGPRIRITGDKRMPERRRRA